VFKREFYAATSVWTAKRRRSAKDQQAPASGETHVWLMQIVQAARSAHMQISSESLALYRALLTAETVTGMLGARTDLRRVGGDFFPSLQIRELLKPPSPLELQSIIGSLVELLKRSPERLEHLLAEVSAGRYTLNVETHESERDQRLANRRAHEITVAIVSVGLAVLLGRGSLPVWFGVSLQWPVGIGLMACYAWLFRQWRRSR
jgi:predicted unusual protein kinase regulating ubiquinone biosynthesis (AarF/ABC1/UbiB family)